MRKILAINSILLLGVTLSWLYPFYCIAKYGKHIVSEPNGYFLLSEIALFAIVIAMSIAGVVLAIMRKEESSKVDDSMIPQYDRCTAWMERRTDL